MGSFQSISSPTTTTTASGLSSVLGSPRPVVPYAIETTQPRETLADTTPTELSDPTELLSSSALPSFDDISATLLRIPDPSPPSPIDAPSMMLSGNWGTSSSYRGRGRNMRGGRTMKGVENRGGRTGPNNSSTEPRLCTYCGGQNHLVATCWKLHGKPDWAMANPISVSVEKHEEKADSYSRNVTLTAEDYVAFQKMKSFMESSIPPLSTDATTIASGNKHLFQSLSPCLPQKFVTTANGTQTKDLTTKQVIGGGHAKEGLYYFTLPPLAAFSSTTSEAQLLHNRLGHPSTPSLRSLLPSLKVLSKFICQSYQEALKRPCWKAAMDEEMHALYENQT
ncbi:uncharacterized protein [Aristolochia californica]|uniref:uncharacterized protein n=1 Tax=Aristolochia californica TaxID=171875 RepID=UPI0035D7B71D